MGIRLGSLNTSARAINYAVPHGAGSMTAFVTIEVDAGVATHWLGALPRLLLQDLTATSEMRSERT